MGLFKINDTARSQPLRMRAPSLVPPKYS